MAEIVVSQMDVEHLAVVRKNVDDTMALAVANHDRPGVRVLEIGPPKTGGAKQAFKHATVTTLDIKAGEGVDMVADICHGTIQFSIFEKYDVVLCFEVLEHTENPIMAASTCLTAIKDGSKIYVTTPFNFRIHGPAPDCWRFTQYGLRCLFRHASKVEFSQIDTPGRDFMPICYQTIVTK